MSESCCCCVGVEIPDTTCFAWLLHFFHKFNNEAFILLCTIASRSKLDNSSRYFILLLLFIFSYN